MNDPTSTGWRLLEIEVVSYGDRVYAAECRRVAKALATRARRAARRARRIRHDIKN